MSVEVDSNGCVVLGISRAADRGKRGVGVELSDSIDTYFSYLVSGNLQIRNG